MEKNIQTPPPIPQAQLLTPPPMPQAQMIAPPPMPQAQAIAPPPMPQAQMIAPPPMPQAQTIAPPPMPQAQAENRDSNENKFKIPENFKKISQDIGKKIEDIDKEKVGNTAKKVMDILSKIYIFDFFRRLFKKNNIGTIIFLILNIGLYIAILGGFTMPEMIPVAITWYFIGLVIALSPIGEFFLRIQSGCKRLKKHKNKEQAARLQRLFDEVYAKAREKDPSISPKVKIFLSKDKDINAFATGRKTVCATTGLLQLNDEEIKGILAHECGHIGHKDTDLLLVILVSNMLLSILFVVIRVIVWTVVFLIGEGESSLGGIGNLIARLLIDILLVTLIRLWTKLGIYLVMHSSRMNEFEADKFACELGYGNQLAYALNHIDGDGDKKSFWSNLRSSHPDTVDRVAKINEYLTANGGVNQVMMDGDTVYREPANSPFGMAAAVSPVAQRKILTPPETPNVPQGLSAFVRTECPQVFQFAYGRFSADGKMYYGQIMNVQNGYYDFMFFDQVREWIPTNYIISVKDALSQLVAAGNQQKRGLYYPCTILGSTPEGKVFVQYQNQVQEILDNEDFMFTCPMNL